MFDSENSAIVSSIHWFLGLSNKALIYGRYYLKGKIFISQSLYSNVGGKSEVEISDYLDSYHNFLRELNNYICRLENIELKNCLLEIFDSFPQMNKSDYIDEDFKFFSFKFWRQKNMTKEFYSNVQNIIYNCNRLLNFIENPNLVIFISDQKTLD
jgi:hypothetical protein